MHRARLTCLPDRERGRDGVGELIYRIYGALLPWFSACGRRFAPAGLTTGGREGNEVCFELEFCDLPPEKESANTQLMDRLSLSLGEMANRERKGQEDGITADYD